MARATPNIGGETGFGGGSRQMLRRLRDVMARPGEVQNRLDEIVRIIAAEMVAEVCSIYVRRPGDLLELSASEGLNPEAVHRTRLHVGEGIVGDIALRARPFALADARSHPKYAYRPETGEEIYQSLMGVPILRSQRVLGVIVVQNRSSRQYADEQVETLETFAMVLGDLISDANMTEGEPGGGTPVHIAGAAVAPGIGAGRVVLHQPDIVIRRVVAEDPASEAARLDAAFEAMHSSIEMLLDVAGESGGETLAVLDTYRMFARDAGWMRRMKEGIESGLTAEAAVRMQQNDLRARLGQVPDPYLRERLADFEDLTNRLLQHLTRGDGEIGRPDDVTPNGLPEDAVIVARAMGPADLLDYDRTVLRGLVLEEGSGTSHVALIARALDIPCVGRATGVVAEVENGDAIIVDGDQGQVFVRPGEEVQTQVQQSLAMREAQRARLEEMRDKPAETKDGVRIQMMMNAGLIGDLRQIEAVGAEGVGLYRTEIPFMVRRDYPGVTEQHELYAAIFEGVDGRPVTFRTLDAGGDKKLQSFLHDAGENPAMGWRSLRISLDRPSLLRQQLRALIMAADGKPLSVMFPMVADVEEFRQARDLLDREVDRARSRGMAEPSNLSVGAMLEVPSLIWQLPSLLAEVDFLSVGSNDLFQFIFAADRGSERLAGRYDTLSPPFLRVLKTISDACHNAHVPVTLCGEMAANPLDAITLVGLGYRKLSMGPTTIAPVKEAIRACNSKGLTEFVGSTLSSHSQSIRENMRFYARDHAIPC